MAGRLPCLQAWSWGVGAGCLGGLSPMGELRAKCPEEHPGKRELLPALCTLREAEPCAASGNKQHCTRHAADPSFLQKELYEPANVGEVLGSGEVTEQSCSLLSSYGALPHGRPAPALCVITHHGTAGMWLQQHQGHAGPAQGNLWLPHTAPMASERSETLVAGGGVPPVLVPLSPSLYCQHARSTDTSGLEMGLL